MFKTSELFTGISIFLGVSLAWASEGPVERRLYVGKDSTEAVMTFSHEVEIESRSLPSASTAKKKINKQLEHLFGPMSFAHYKSVPRGNEVITQIQISKKGQSTYAASYSYRGTIVLQNGPDSQYEVTLPNNPDRIYASGMVLSGGEKTYPCTDHHYQSEGDFWYFWNPKQYGCLLKQGQDYQIVQTKISRFKNTVRTYPEYSRLVENGKIELHILMGMDDPKHGRDPRTSEDINADNWQTFRTTLLTLGFSERAWSDAEIFNVIPSGTDKPSVTEFTKQDQKATLVIRLFFGPSGISEESKAFHYFFKDAIDHAALMFYDGHSGLGGHLDLDSIEETEGFKFEPNKNKYQIYFFDSCTSYTYYNTMYFDRKVTGSDPKGTKNLDIMTNGLATFFSVMDSSNASVVRAVDAWASNQATISYQDLAADIDSGNLFGINGDEDNPTSP